MTRMMNGLRLIAAIGKRGQLGLNGKLPWCDPLDMKMFVENTRGSVLIMGYRTAQTVGPLRDRTIIVPRRDETEADVLARCLEAAKGDALISARKKQLVPYNTAQLPVWLAGGAATYARFMPWVRQSLITHVDYDGPADAWLRIGGEHDQGR